MNNITLENERVRIEVALRGAQLCSLFSKDTNLEYLWQPGADTWPHHSMLLFPNAGRIARDRVIIDGKTYPAMMHGFANDLEFENISSEGEIWLQLKDSEYTRKYFPYRFRLQVGFSLLEDKVIQRFRIINEDEHKMYFSLGAHPGFYCPIVLEESAEEYSLYFDSAQKIDLLHMEQRTRLLTGETTAYLDDASEVELAEDFFDNGPILLGGVNAKTITLRSKRSGYFMEMGISDFPYMCLWGVPGKMSLIAIEPWCGTSDCFDTDHVWEHKPGIESVEVGETFERILTFRMGKEEVKRGE